MKNQLVVIGWCPNFECYLNIPVEEALKRYNENNTEQVTNKNVSILDFDDVFQAYDITDAVQLKG